MLKSTATDNIGVSKVEFYANNSLRCTDTTSPYSCTWTQTGGVSYQAKAKAYDASGNVGTSGRVSVTVN